MPKFNGRDGGRPDQSVAGGVLDLQLPGQRTLTVDGRTHTDRAEIILPGKATRRENQLLRPRTPTDTGGQKLIVPT